MRHGVRHGTDDGLRACALAPPAPTIASRHNCQAPLRISCLARSELAKGRAFPLRAHPARRSSHASSLTCVLQRLPLTSTFACCYFIARLQGAAACQWRTKFIWRHVSLEHQRSHARMLPNHPPTSLMHAPTHPLTHTPTHPPTH